MSRNVAVMLGGQASQEVGMGHEAYKACDEARRIFDIAGQAAKKDLTEYCWGSKTDELDGAIVQPALGAALLADLAWMKQKGLKPALYMGHSVNEITALGAAGAFSLEDTFKILTVRGLAMEEADKQNPGEMRAFIGHTPEEMKWLLEFANSRIQKIQLSAAWIAMSNWREQHVVSGDNAVMNLLEKTSIRLHEMGRVRKARVRFVRKGAAHTPYMEPAAERLREEIERASKNFPELPVLANDGNYLLNPDLFADYLVGQLTNTADWRLSMWVAATDGYRYFAEPGAKDLMTSFLKKEFPEHSILKKQFGNVVKLEQVPEMPDDINRQFELLAA